MFHHKQADKAATAEAFARALHDDWGVGNPACQNGALLLLAVGDKQVCTALRCSRFLMMGHDMTATATQARATPTALCLRLPPVLLPLLLIRC